MAEIHMMVGIEKVVESGLNKNSLYILETIPHQMTVEMQAVPTAKNMGLSNEKVENVQIAARYHDVGKIQFPKHLIDRIHAELTPNDIRLIQDHPKIGARIISTKLAEVNGRYLPTIKARGIIDIMEAHHIHYEDNSNTRIEAQVIHVVDSADAMRFRPYRSFNYNYEEAAVELKECSGIPLEKCELPIRDTMNKRDLDRAKRPLKIEFNPKVVEAYLKIPKRRIDGIYELVKLQYQRKTNSQ